MQSANQNTLSGCLTGPASESAPGATGQPARKALHWNNPWLVLPLASAIFLACSIVFPPQHSLWLDETASYFIAVLPWGEFWELLSNAEANMSLYYLLLKFHLMNGFTSPYYIRALSALFGVLAIACLYCFSAAAINRRVAACVTLVAAFNPFLFYYSWEARSYSLTLLFGSILLWQFWRCMAQNRKSDWILYGILAGLGLYSHIFFALMIVAQYCFALAYTTLQRNFPVYFYNLLLAGSILSAIAAPLLYFLVAASGEATNIAWLKPVGLSSTWSFLKNILKTNYSWGIVPRVLTVLLLVSSFAIAATNGIRAYKRDRASRRAAMVLYLAMCTLIPVLLTYGLQFIKPVFLDRYLIYVAPAFLLLCCWSILSIPWPQLRLAALGALCLTQLIGLQDSFNADRYDYDRLYTDLSAACEPGSTLVFTFASVATTYFYYQDKYPRLTECFHSVIPDELNHQNFYDLAEFDDLPLQEHAGKLWVVYGHRSNAGSSIYKIHEPGFLAQRGYGHAFYRKYNMDLALLRLDKHAEGQTWSSPTLAGIAPAPPGDPSHSSEP